MRLDDLSHNAQAQTGFGWTTWARTSPEAYAGFEDGLQAVGRNTGPAVGNAKMRIRPIPPYSDADLAARCVRDGVAQ